jgi:hypothetical protein
MIHSSFAGIFVITTANAHANPYIRLAQDLQGNYAKRYDASRNRQHLKLLLVDKQCSSRTKV